MPQSKHVAKRHPNAIAKFKKKQKEKEDRRKLMVAIFGGQGAFRQLMRRELHPIPRPVPH